MKPRTLLVLLALVLGLGAFIAFFERDLPSSEEREKLGKKVLPIAQADVRAVAIERDGKILRLERVEGKGAAKDKKPAANREGDDEPALDTASGAGAEWRLTRPLAARADAAEVGRLVEALAGLEKTRTIEDPDPKALGLDKPRATVRLATAKGEKVLAIGAAVPTGGATVVRVQGEPRAYVVSDTLWTDLARDPGEWRDKQVFPAEREAIARVTLEGGAGGRVLLARRGEEFWLESPIADRADRDLVEALLTDLTGLSALRFVDAPGPAAELGLAPPRGVVEAVLEGRPAPVKVELGAPVGGGDATTAGETSPSEPATSYARIGRQVFTTQARLGEALARSAADWRSKALSGIEVYQVESARIDDGKGAMTLRRSGSDWKRGAETISYTPVSDFLYAVSAARADRLLALAEARAMGAALDRPALTVALQAEGGGKETITLYPPVAAGVPARASGRDPVLLLPKDTLQDLQKKAADVRAAKPLPKEGKKAGDKKEEGT